jgi:hypothetical protein
MLRKVIVFLISVLILCGVFLYFYNQTRLKEPNIYLDILFSAHASAKDLSLGFLKDRLNRSDIFLIEYAAWDGSFEEDANKVSQGNLRPEEFFSKRGVSVKEVETTFQFLKLQLEALYNSKVFVTSADVRSGDPIGTEIKKMLPTIDRFRLSMDFNETIDFQRTLWKKFGDLQARREQYMVSQIMELSDSINKRQVKAVEEKKKVRILFVLGANHVKVSDLLKEKKMNVSKEFSQNPFIYNYSAEITVKYIAGENISDELLAYGLFENGLAQTLEYPWINDYDMNTQAKFMRNVVPQFTFREIKNIFEKTAISVDHEAVFQKEVLDLAKEKNVKIPTTREEFDKFIF